LISVGDKIYINNINYGAQVAPYFIRFNYKEKITKENIIQKLIKYGVSI